MARATKEDSEATGRRILAEAGLLFSTLGYAGVSLDAAAEAASVTRGAVYHHFGSKRGLFEAVAARAQLNVAEAVVHAADNEADPWEAMLAGCRAFLTASLAEDRRRVLLVDAPAVLGWNSWRQQDAAASGTLLHGALTDLAERGLIQVGSVAAATALLSGAMNEAALAIADSQDGKLTLDDVMSDLRRMLHGIRSQ
ncbi:MAG: TetR family transcriptional regulator [Arachnia sp.]